MSKIYDSKANRFVNNYLETFLSMGDGADHETINAIQRFMERNAYYMTASQLRNIYSRLKTSTPANIPLLRVKLAYVRGRTDNRDKGMHVLLSCLDDMMQQINPKGENSENKKLDSLKAFFEAMLAYHKFYENIKPRR